MKFGKIFTYIFAAIALIFEGFFGVIPFVYFVIQIILLSFALYFVVWIFRSKTLGVWHKIIPKYAGIILATVGFFTSIFLVFIQYQYSVPGVVSDITLSNSGQEIVFVEMSHIATPEFYLKKKATIAALAQSGYTILVEGVKPGTPENQKLFNQSLGFNFTPTLYTTIADIIALSSQDNKMLFENISTGSLVSVDISIDDIIKLMGTGSVIDKEKNTTVLSKIIADIINILDQLGGSNTDIETLLRSITYQEKLYFRWMAGGLLNWSLRQSDDIDAILNSGSQARFFETIIDRRNDKIVEYIEKHPNENIVIVYGALHFNGVYEALQAKNKGWSIVQMQTSEPYSR